MMRTPIRFAATLATLALLGFMLTSASAVRADDSYEINAVLSLTGSGAFLGTAERDALHTLEVRVNGDGGIGGRQIHFVVADDRSDPALAARLVTGFAAKRVSIVIGSSLSPACNAMLSAVKSGPVLYCLTPGIRPEPNSFVFSAGFSTRDMLAVATRYMRARGLIRIGLITSTDATGQEADRSITETLALPENRGMELVAREHIEPLDTNATPQMTHIKAAAPQILIAWAAGTPFGVLLRSASEAGVGLPILTSNENLTHAQMTQYAGVLPPELLFPAGPSYAPDDIKDKATRDAVGDYLAEFSQQGVRADAGDSLAWDPAMLLMSALRKLGTTASAAQLRGYFAEQRSWIGINGSYNFRGIPQRGLGPSGVVMVRWDKAQDTWAGVSHPGGTPLP